MKDNAVRRQMIEAAARLFQKQGYAETSWRELVQEAGTPWGSAYHYFPGGKEELAVEAVKSYASGFREEFDAICGTTSKPDERIRIWFERAARTMHDSNYSLGCPMAGISLNAVPKSPALSELCKKGFETWRNYLAGKIIMQAEIEQCGEITAKTLANERALIVLASFEGALVLARSLGTSEPLVAAARYLSGLFELSGAQRGKTPSIEAARI